MLIIFLSDLLNRKQSTIKVSQSIIGQHVHAVFVQNQTPEVFIFILRNTVRNRMYYNYERGVTTWLYIDEVQSLFGHPATISYFSRFWAEGRKFNLICTGITQNCTYLLNHKDGCNLILNSDFLMLHRQSFADKAKWSELLNLSEQEGGFIDESINPGDGLLIAGGSRVPIVDDFPKGALYDLFNTKPDEIAERKRAEYFAKRAAMAEELAASEVTGDVG